MLTLLYSAIMMLAPSLLLAHPGDHTQMATSHFLSSPWHVPGLLVLAVSLAVLARRGLAGRATARKREDRHGQ